MSTPSNNHMPRRKAWSPTSRPPTSPSSSRPARASRLGAVIIDGLVFGRAAGCRPTVSRSAPLFRSGHFTALEPLGRLCSATGMLFYIGSLIDLALWIVVAVMVHRNAQIDRQEALGIKVARTDGSRATLGRIFWLRNVVNLRDPASYRSSARSMASSTSS